MDSLNIGIFYKNYYHLKGDFNCLSFKKSEIYLNFILVICEKYCKQKKNHLVLNVDFLCLETKTQNVTLRKEAC
ncbi:hypothetical protein BpHYR1_014560 [Brachionus plicatilis]|uniref:Uncharacterized protein n=1 Tax=Brachionus plicatilis TaxID=10195 RepID=A0A3M7PT95_BRAPC|nr:hypothetical protein BpHYR1_014560 [Brachionus plicatilis]